MINPFIPAYVYEKKQRRFSALIMVLALTPLIVFNLTRNVSATQTHTWDSSDFSAGTFSNTLITNDTITLPVVASSSNSTAEELRLGFAAVDPFALPAIPESGGLEIGQGYLYNTNSIPALSRDYVSAVFYEGGSLYIASNDSVSVINTQGTESPDDDTLITRYNASSTPAVTGNISGMFMNAGILYISTYDTGLYVINTQSTLDPSDDTLVTRYHTGSTPALVYNNRVNTATLSGNFLYIGIEAGLMVLDTQGTVDASDDVVITRYAQGMPGWTHNNTTSIVVEGSAIFAATYDGVCVVDTKGTLSPADDTLVTRYHTGSTPALGGNVINHVFYSDDILYVSTREGLSSIDTQGTLTDASDDTLVTRYYTDSTPSTGGKYIYKTSRINDFLYVNNNRGLSIIDTKGTFTNASDDVLVSHYDTNSTPALQSNYAVDSFIVNNQLYIGGTGLSVFTLDTYRPFATYYGSVRSIALTPTTTVTYTADSTDGQSVELSYRTGESEAVYFNDFNDGFSTEYLGDWGGWGHPFQDVEESGGTMKFSNPDSYAYVNNNGGADVWIDTGYPDGYFEIGSRVTARIRINSNTRLIQDWYEYVFADDWWDGSEGGPIPNNEWRNVSFTTSTKNFSKIGFEIGWQTGTWSPSDTLEIDWIEVTTPDSMGEWGSWTVCSGSTCALADLGSAQWLQYKLDLTTTDTSTTPVVHSVSYNGDYISTGTYTSGTQTFDRAQDLVTFNAVDNTPDGTGITYEFSTDEGDTWQSITPGTTLSRFDVVTDTFMWRATLSTLDPAYAPTIESVTLTTSVHENLTHTSLQTQLDKLEENGNHEAVLRLKEKYPHFFDGTASDTEIRLQMILILREALALLETSPKNSE